MLEGRTDDEGTTVPPDPSGMGETGGAGVPEVGVRTEQPGVGSGRWFRSTVTELPTSRAALTSRREWADLRFKQGKVYFSLCAAETEGMVVTGGEDRTAKPAHPDGTPRDILQAETVDPAETEGMGDAPDREVTRATAERLN